MLHKMKRWFLTHFGGRMELEEVASYTNAGNLWFGRNPAYLVISYKGVTWAWEKDLMKALGKSEKETFIHLVAFVLGTFGTPRMTMLHQLTTTDFDDLQRKHGAFIQEGYVRASDIDALKLEIKPSVRKFNLGESK